MSVRSLGLSLLSLVSCIKLSAASAQLASNGLSVTLNDVYYFISPFSSGKVLVKPTAFPTVPSVFGFKPVTVVQGAVAEEALPSLFANWSKIDDVFQPAFAQAIFLAGSITCLTKRGTAARDLSTILSIDDTSIPSGPYFLEMATGFLHPVYRLYEDFAGAFTEPLIPTPGGKFQVLSAQIPGSAALTVGVPSRLYFTKTAAKPLAGVRLGVKDIYRLAGMKGSNGNRAWYSIYPASESTGPAVQALIDAGAQVIGLQKTSQFANGESATADWVDYHMPFNPRGDGYQDASSSSSGGGASVASYEWLDIAIGSDTGGSIRNPAAVQGLFGNRPSHGLASLDKVMPLSPTLDTPGFLVRDPYLWDTANAVLYGDNYKSLANTQVKYPNKIRTIYFPSDPTGPESSAADAIMTSFVNALATFVNGTIEPLELDTAWDASTPAEAAGIPLGDFLNTTYATLITKEQIALVRDPFYADYAAIHDGRHPFVNPVPLVRWGYGDTLSEGDYEAAKREKAIFMDWFNSVILPTVDQPGQCSSGFVLYPSIQGDQIPRNRYGGEPGVPFGFNPGRISVFSEAPDSTFPLGQVSSLSAITNHDELFPVGVDIMVAKGCDGLLVKLAQDLVKAGILTAPLTGGTVTGGDILMKRRAEEKGIKKVRYVEYYY
ncbi:glutamyl-tRNA amidotransferase [Lasiosphaeris hirsuta]|uniref:Glutamyl-tRNA amidotransferase n=1 Tax=Lasiosphaeris hirsuta TaxID=260670 RepID=A0AA40E6N6_9PEZI|nr:glutamyl-tRNA amidotransferase [Lasiosphaeris hirsuta]